MNCTVSGVAMRPRTQFLRVLASAVETSRMSLDQRVLMLGSSAEDEPAFRQEDSLRCQAAAIFLCGQRNNCANG
jgi:hypothetical protein